MTEQKNASRRKINRAKIRRTKMASRVEGVVLGVLLLVSLAHLLRLVSGTELIIAGKVIPLWTSLIGFLGPAMLAWLFWWSRPRR